MRCYPALASIILDKIRIILVMMLIAADIPLCTEITIVKDRIITIMAIGLVKPTSQIISIMTDTMLRPIGAMIIQDIGSSSINKKEAMIISLATETIADKMITMAVIAITLTVETIVSGLLIDTIIP